MAARGLKRWLPPSAAGVAVVALVVATGLGLAHGGSLSWIPVWAVPAIGCVGVGFVLCSRVPGNPIGWLFLVVGTLLAIGLACDAYARAEPSAGAAASAAESVAYLFETVPVILLPTVLLLFPDGRLPSPRWKPVGVAWLVVTMILVLHTLLAPDTLVLDSNLSVQNPIGLSGAAGSVVSSGLILVFVLGGVIVAAAMSLILRYRRATGDLRQQLKWFGAGAVLMAVAAVLIPIFGNMGAPWGTVVLDSLWSLAITGMVVTTGVAILRYRLYEIDVIVRKTLVYTTLVGCLALAYLGAAYLLDRGLQTITGQSGTLAVTLSTLAVVAIFQPLRARIQTVIDHRFYRQKYDGVKTLESFAGRLREQIDLDALCSDLLGVIQVTVHPAHASLVLLGSPQNAPAPAGVPSPVGPSNPAPAVQR
jgi:hypothetical protein